MTTRYWIGVASREHVKAAEAGGFCQFCHGRGALVRKLSAGDGVIYYSPAAASGGDIVHLAAGFRRRLSWRGFQRSTSPFIKMATK